ncbi:receptor-like protein EIX2 [Silene latifolia]|uniref:receptor-like protein EIX2 n=1 Tax=Silene latifolia TaxID=37657 RepID=UPI003D773C28
MGNIVISCLLFCTFIFLNPRWCHCNGNSPNNSALRCIPSERAALLNFKQNLTFFDKDVSSSWQGEECCNWRRVGCDKTTGRILKLNLSGDDTNNLIKMEKLESLVYLLELKQLESLDLSFNDFGHRSIPRFMGSMKQLRYLNLSFASFGGLVPYDFGNLTNLQVLDMRSDWLSDYEIVVDNLGWVSGLRELRYLNMNHVNMSYSHDWIESLIGPLPYIRELYLSNCGLTLYKAVHKNSSTPAHLPPISYLDLSTNNLSEDILRILQNLTSLEHLNLLDSIHLPQFNFHGNDSRNLWGLVHNLCTLRSLDLSSNDLQGNFLQQRQNLSNNCFNHYDLEDLSIKSGSLTGYIPGWLGEDFRSLKSISLSLNKLSGEIPASIGKLSSLRTLDLFNNMLSGEIPVSLGMLSNLKELDLSANNLTSVASFYSFPSNLETLSLGGNRLSGKIPTSIGQLSKLKRLSIDGNPLEGVFLSEPHFSNLSSLTYLNIDDTLLTLNLSSEWVPPFQLQLFSAVNCKINGRFPPWLLTQKNLSSLTLSNANISGEMPRWFHTMQLIDYVDLSNNNLSGSPILPINFYIIDLSNNSLSGDFVLNDRKTEVYLQANRIDLTNNSIAGPLPENLGHIMPNLELLLLANNQITGPIPRSLCQLTSLSNLDIQNNRLSGVIPNCWANISTLLYVSLSYNKLKGHIPCFNNRDSFKFGLGVQFYLHLNDNMLSGEIPSCLSDLPNLQILDIGGNQLSGKMNKWFRAENLSELKILRLKGNKFSGTIPWQICSLPQLQLLDLGNNQFTGYIPRCLSNLTAMTSPNDSIIPYLSDVSEVYQGIERTYTSSVAYLVDIDLSCNNLVGSIPDDITKLSGLLSLNLSCNKLSGTIPENIGGLKSLIALDLSNNKLRGTIPTSMGQLYKLSHLNLSYNNLSGEIPTGNQLQTLSDQASVYAGNPYLCGDFLPRKCKSKADELGKGTRDKGNGDKEKKLKKMGFDLVVVSGFATGFWGVVGCLVLNSRWRHEFFRRLEDGYNWLYVIVVLKVRVLKAKMKRGE